MFRPPISPFRRVCPGCPRCRSGAPRAGVVIHHLQASLSPCNSSFLSLIRPVSRAHFSTSWRSRTRPMLSTAKGAGKVGSFFARSRRPWREIPSKFRRYVSGAACTGGRQDRRSSGRQPLPIVDCQAAPPGSRAIRLDSEAAPGGPGASCTSRRLAPASSALVADGHLGSVTASR